MIHKIDNSFVVSSDGVWLPGCYDSERAAKYAFSFPDEKLQRLQDEVNAREPDALKRVITFEMLQKLQSKREDKNNG